MTEMPSYMKQVLGVDIKAVSYFALNDMLVFLRKILKCVG